MTMLLIKNRAINDVREEFNNAYPFLSIDFYKHELKSAGLFVRQRLNKTTSLVNAGIRHEGEIDIIETMTVRQLEQSFKDEFGLEIQISRKSGNVWLETTISDEWTLKQQNDHGRELSEPVKTPFINDRPGYD
jgi:hypothetical protein